MLKPATLDDNGAWDALLQLLEQQERTLVVASDRTRTVLRQLSALSLCGLPATSTKPDIEEITDSDAIKDVMDKVVLLANEQVRVMHHMLTQREELNEGVARNRAVRERGVAVRTIYQNPVGESARNAAHLRRLHRLGVQVRRAPLIPFCLVVVDDNLALVSSPEPTDKLTQLLLIRRPAVVRLLSRVFEFCWDGTTDFLPPTSVGVGGSRATPVAPVPQPVQTGVGADGGPEPGERALPSLRLTGQQLVVLRLWASGRSDATIARELQVSPRTLRRIVSTLLRRLGVATRFEAGLVAAHIQGLLEAPRLPVRSLQV